MLLETAPSIRAFGPGRTIVRWCIARHGGGALIATNSERRAAPQVAVRQSATLDMYPREQMRYLSGMGNKVKQGPIRRRHGHVRDNDWELTPAQIADLKERLRDSRDPKRYLIISRMLPGVRFVLYYNVSDDVYAYDNPEGGTLFKRLEAAELIHKHLDRGNEIIAVKVRRGKIIGTPRRRKRSNRSTKD